MIGLSQTDLDALDSDDLCLAGNLGPSRLQVSETERDDVADVLDGFFVRSALRIAGFEGGTLRHKEPASSCSTTTWNSCVRLPTTLSLAPPACGALLLYRIHALLFDSNHTSPDGIAQPQARSCLPLPVSDLEAESTSARAAWQLRSAAESRWQRANGSSSQLVN